MNDIASSDLQLCAGGVVFNVHREVLSAHSLYIRQFLESPVKRRRLGSGIVSLDISLPELGIASKVIGKNATPLQAFETFLSLCYQPNRMSHFCSEDLFAVAVIADFMISETILSEVDSCTAHQKFAHQLWTAVFAFSKSFRLRRTCENLLETQSTFSFQVFSTSEVFFKLEETEMLAILRNSNLPILAKIFAIFWRCTGLNEEAFGQTEFFKISGDNESSSFVRFMDLIVPNVNDKTTLEFLLKMMDRFELLSNDGHALPSCMLYRIIAKRALNIKR